MYLMKDVCMCCLGQCVDIENNPFYIFSICLAGNTRFATQKTLSVHQRSHHGLERCVYVCPICQATFLSMWAVVKHLQRCMYLL